ncbi:MAG: hypothetical protein IPF54_04530 [Draconibacterium sp.]|nr:hypothetical protein [Draconibacterium sp.]
MSFTTKSIPNKTLIRVMYIFVIIVALCSYFYGLQIDVTRDAGKYATVAKETFQNGELH